MDVLFELLTKDPSLFVEDRKCMWYHPLHTIILCYSWVEKYRSTNGNHVLYAQGLAKMKLICLQPHHKTQKNELLGNKMYTMRE